MRLGDYGTAASRYVYSPVRAPSTVWAAGLLIGSELILRPRLSGHCGRNRAVNRWPSRWGTLPTSAWRNGSALCSWSSTHCLRFQTRTRGCLFRGRVSPPFAGGPVPRGGFIPRPEPLRPGPTIERPRWRRRTTRRLRLGQKCVSALSSPRSVLSEHTVYLIKEHNVGSTSGSNTNGRRGGTGGTVSTNSPVPNQPGAGAPSRRATARRHD